MQKEKKERKHSSIKPEKNVMLYLQSDTYTLPLLTIHYSRKLYIK